ncbi:MAG: hypothetical protein H7A32_03555 [Deltaproteobacteria bacterium]|nr:hypothetical protein [Deltaproteobacteria bacterium]
MSVDAGRSSQELNLAGFQKEAERILEFQGKEVHRAIGKLNVRAKPAIFFKKSELQRLLGLVSQGRELKPRDRERIGEYLNAAQLDVYVESAPAADAVLRKPSSSKSPTSLFGSATAASATIYGTSSEGSGDTLMSVDPSLVVEEELLASFPPEPESHMSEVASDIDRAADGTIGPFSTDDPQQQTISDAWEAKDWTPPKGNWWKETKPELKTLFSVFTLLAEINRQAVSDGKRVPVPSQEMSVHRLIMQRVVKSGQALANNQSVVLKALLYIEANLHHVEESDTLIIRAVLKKWLGRELQAPASVSNEANAKPVVEALPVRYVPSARSDIDYNVLSAALAKFSDLLDYPNDALNASVAESFRKSNFSVPGDEVQRHVKHLSDQISEAHASFEELLHSPDIEAERLEVWTREHSGLSALALVLTGQGHRPHARAILDLTEGHYNSAWAQTLGEILESPMGIHVHELQEIMRRSFNLLDTPNMRPVQETVARRVFERPDLAKAFADAGVTEHEAINIIETVLASDAAALLPVDAPELAQASPVGLEALSEQEIIEIQKMMDVALNVPSDVNLNLSISVYDLRKRAGWIGRGLRVVKANFNRRNDFLESTNPRTRAALSSATAHICNLVAVIRADRITRSNQSTPLLSSILRKLMPTLDDNREAQEHTLKSVAKNWTELAEPDSTGRAYVPERNTDLARANEIATEALKVELTRLENQKKSRLIETRQKVGETYPTRELSPDAYAEAALEFTQALYDLFKGDLDLRHARYAGIARDIQSERGFLTFLTNYQNAELMSEWLSERGFSNFDLGPKPIQSIAYTGFSFVTERSGRGQSGFIAEDAVEVRGFEDTVGRDRSDRTRSRVGRPARGAAEFTEERQEAPKAKSSGRNESIDVEGKAKSKPRGRGPGGIIKGK